MAITLNGTTLPDLVIEDEFSTPAVIGRTTPTAGGGANIQEMAIISGQPLDLVGGDDFGWIDRSVLVTLYALLVPNATYALVYESTTYTVRFRTEEEDPIQATPIVPRPNHDTTDKYNNVRLKLMRV
jgi:hypothetical protein